MTTETLVLEETLAISEIETLYETLKCMAATEQDVVIDATAVASLDTASAQLLVSFIRQVEENGCTIQWAGASEAFAKTAKLLNLEQCLLTAA